jgi:hypothetical protein
MMDFFDISLCFFDALKGHAEFFQQCKRFFIGARRSHDRDVHTGDLVDFVDINFREDNLLLDAKVVVAATIKGFCEIPRKSRIRGIATVIKRSRNSYILSRRIVTRQPMAMP